MISHVYRRIDPDKPAATIIAGGGGGTWGYHYPEPRSLTNRERARLQTFPDWYLFAGKRTTGGIRRAGNPRESIFDRELPKYTQIGNAVPVKLAYEIGKHFLSII